MDNLLIGNSQKRSFREILEKYKTRLISFITPRSTQIKRLKKIEGMAEKIAKENQIPFPFRCEIRYQKGKSFHSIGCSFSNMPKYDGKFNIYIYSPYLMASEFQILLTIFHECGHFFHDYASVPSILQLLEFYPTNKFPKFSGTDDFTEDYCELFACRMLNLVSIDEKVSNLMDRTIKSAIQNMEKEDGLQKP